MSPPLLHVSGRGSEGALVAGLVAGGVPRRFGRLVASSGAALGLLAWELGGARGLRHLLGRHSALLAGVDTSDQRLHDAGLFLRHLGVDPDALLEERGRGRSLQLLLLAFD
jgi:hypothetical protein